MRANATWNRFPQSPELTLDELRQKLAMEKLVEYGCGLVSTRTFRQIVALCVPVPDEVAYECNKFTANEINIGGVRLICNDYVPDGQIWPYKPWEWKLKAEPVKEYPLDTKDKEHLL